MKVSINRASATDSPTWEAVEGSAQEVAGLLRQGGEIGPSWVERGDKVLFQSADWLFVGFDEPAHLVAGLLAQLSPGDRAALMQQFAGGKKGK